MISTRYTDRRGNTITQLEWELLREVRDYRHVVESARGSYLVRTEWVGTETAPFRTTVFDGSKPRQAEQATPQTYRTEKDALAGHARLVELVRVLGTAPAEDLVQQVAQVVRGRSWPSWF